MATLSNHFGEDASLGEDETKEILEYLMKHSADTKAASPRSKRIARMIPKDEKPLRITETPFWERRHYSIKRYVFDRKEIASKAKCEACHRDAAKHLRNSGAQRSTYPFGFGYPKWLAGLPNKSPGPVAGFE